MGTFEPNIRVKLDLFADLRRYLPAGQGGPLVVQCTAGTRISALLDRLKISPDAETAVSLNGELASINHVLHDGDEVVLFGPSAGG